MDCLSSTLINVANSMRSGLEQSLFAIFLGGAIFPAPAPRALMRRCSRADVRLDFARATPAQPTKKGPGRVPRLSFSSATDYRFSESQLDKVSIL